VSAKCGASSPRPTGSRATTRADHAKRWLDAIGPERIVWGSDWPRHGLRGPAHLPRNPPNARRVGRAGSRAPRALG
jgi:predicted TIM-barrel fold metal-dependent hydrolase